MRLLQVHHPTLLELCYETADSETLDERRIPYCPSADKRFRRGDSIYLASVNDSDVVRHGNSHRRSQPPRARKLTILV